MRSSKPAVLFAALCILSSCGGDSNSPVEPSPDPAEWSWVNPLPLGNTLRGVGGWTEFDLFAVGDRGRILRHPDFDEWREIESPTDETLYDVIGFGPGETWFVGASGTVLRWDGSEFSVESTPATQDIRGIWGTSGTDLWTTHPMGVMTRDAAGWRVESVTSQPRIFHDVWGLEGGEKYAVGVSGAVVHFDGAAWSEPAPFTAATLRGVWADKPGDWFAVGDGGEIWHNAGAGWSPMSSPVTGDLYAVFGSDSAYVFAVGATDSILFYDDVSWTKIAANPVRTLRAGWGEICPLPGRSRSPREALHCSNQYIVGDGGAGVSFDLFGMTNVETDAVTYRDLNAVTVVSSNEALAVGDAGEILRYDGAAWTTIPVATNVDLLDVATAASGSYVLAGRGGTIVRISGGVPIVLDTGAGSDFHGAWAASTSDAVVCGDAGAVYRFDGSNWSPANAPAADYRGAWGTADGNEVWLVGTGGTIVRSVGGADFAAVASPVARDLYDIFGFAADDVIAVGEDGAIVHWDGAAWIEQATPSTENLLAVWGSAGDAAIAVTNRGNAIRYDGEKWRFEVTAADDELRGVSGTALSDLTAVGRSGAIVHYSR